MRHKKADDYLVLPHYHPKKNPHWSGATPNEWVQKRADYNDFLRRWAAQDGLALKPLFFEVRVIKQQSALEIHQSSRWWDQRPFMEAIFWVFQSPVTFYPEGKEPFQCYVLEPFECHRVWHVARQMNAHDQFSDPWPRLMIPCDVVDQAWNETSNGFSDHIRPREPIMPTQLEQDVRGMVEEAKRELELFDVGDKFDAPVEDYSEPIAPHVDRLAKTLRSARSSK